MSVLGQQATWEHADGYRSRGHTESNSESEVPAQGTVLS
jgi:hypothetical protein